jgi:hypothetical protein
VVDYIIDKRTAGCAGDGYIAPPMLEAGAASMSILTATF